MADEDKKRGLNFHNNKFGWRGVEWAKDRNKFRSRIVPPDQPRGRWLGCYDTAVEAASAYDAEARKIYGSDARLNFPYEWEQSTINSDRSSGVCANGHDLMAHGYDRSDGRGQNCKKCNAAANSRLYYRNKAKAAGKS